MWKVNRERDNECELAMWIPAYIIEELEKQEQRRREAENELTIQRSTVEPPAGEPVANRERGVEEVDFFI